MSELVAAAFHESGHAVATVWAFRDAKWLPKPPPALPVRYVEIIQNGRGWGGTCCGADIYSLKWPLDCIAERYRPLMEKQVCIHLAGGISEAVHLGIRNRHEVLRFAETHCGIDDDLVKASDVLRELFRLTGRHHDERHFAEPTLAMLLKNWPAVEALATVLVANRRIEGEVVELIIDHA